MLLELVAQSSISPSFVYLVFQAFLLLFLFFLGSPSFFGFSAEGHQVAFREEIIDQIPELSIGDEMLDIFILQVVGDRRATGQVQKCLIDKAIPQLIVASMELGVSFFED